MRGHTDFRQPTQSGREHDARTNSKRWLPWVSTARDWQRPLGRQTSAACGRPPGLVLNLWDLLRPQHMETDPAAELQGTKSGSVTWEPSRWKHWGAAKGRHPARTRSAVTIMTGLDEWGRRDGWGLQTI